MYGLHTCHICADRVESFAAGDIAGCCHAVLRVKHALFGMINLTCCLICMNVLAILTGAVGPAVGIILAGKAGSAKPGTG